MHVVQRSRRRSNGAPVMADVARAAGVSMQTVSRVLNTPNQVSATTRERVHRAIGELGYRPNSTARALASNRSRLLGVLTPAVTLFGPSQIAMAVETSARAEGYSTVSATSPAVGASAATVLDHFHTLGVEGVIILAPTAPDVEAAERLSRSLPVVIISARPLVSGTAAHVLIDHRSGARAATGHLVSLGHRRIGHIAGPRQWLDAQEREAGWREALGEAGCEPGPLLPGSWQPESGYAAGRAYLALRSAPTAVFAANDYLALGFIRAVTEAGLRVGEDVGLVGYDDMIGLDCVVPSLTSVRQPFAEAGLRALDLLLARIDGEPSGGIVVTPELVVRESSGPAR